MKIRTIMVSDDRLRGWADQNEETGLWVAKCYDHGTLVDDASPAVIVAYLIDHFEAARHADGVA